MKVMGAKVRVGDSYSDLIGVSLNGDSYYFERDPETEGFNFIFSRNSREDAKRRLENSGAKPYVPKNSETEKNFTDAIRSFERDAIRFQLEGFLETLVEKDKMGKEE